MTGRYKVYLPLDSAHRAFDACWHRFVAVCSSLDRDGLSYDVTFNFAPTAEQCSDAVPGPYALITAQGKPKPRVQRRTRASIMPPMLSAEQIKKRLMAAKRAIIPAASNGACWYGGYQDWRQLRNRQRAIGRIIARIKAQDRNTLNESDIRRYQLATGHDWAWIKLTPEMLMQEAKRVYKVFRPYQPPQPAAHLLRLAQFAEYAYWRELARLLADRRAA